MTPKIRVLVVYARKWVETFNQSMIAISEGPFEILHDDYSKYEENFKIPRPPPGNDSDSDEEESSIPDTPACGTRSGAQKKRKAVQDSDTARRVKARRDVENLLQTDPDQQRKDDTRRKMTVRKRRVCSVAAHFARQLFRFQDRLQQAAALSGRRTTRQSILPWNEGLSTQQATS